MIFPKNAENSAMFLRQYHASIKKTTGEILRTMILFSASFVKMFQHLKSSQT